MHITSKLSSEQVTIFTEMSALAQANNACNLGQGFPDFDPPDDLMLLVDKYMKSGKNQYAPMTGVQSLREAIAKKVFQLYNRSVDANFEVTVTAGATQAIFTMITAIVHQKDEVIIFEPAYDSYRPAIEIAGGKAVVYTMEAPDFIINWAMVKAMVNERTKMIIINTPHNPTGTILKGEDMMKLSELVRDKDIFILSDEVYEHLVYDNKKHESILKYPELYQRSLAVFSFGKTYHCTGWKIGYCVGPEYIMKEFRKIHQWNVFCVNSFIQYALAEYMEDASTYMQLHDFYQQKRDFFQKLMEETAFRPLKSEGTFFQLYDYSLISKLDDVTFARELTVKNRVAAIPVSVFYSDIRQDKLIRFCFAKSEKLLKDAAELLCKL